MPGTHPRQYLISLISPTFVKIVIRLPAELMRAMQQAFAAQARVIVLILHEL